MLKVGTVFSGIGAIEHALQRMRVEHSIEFACDNGDIDIMSKKIDSDIDSIIEEIDFLNQEDLEDNLYDNAKIKSHFNEVINKIRKSLVDAKNIDRLKNEYIQTGLPNDNQRKAYKDFENRFNNTDNNISKKFIIMQLSIKLEGDIKRSSLENDKKEKMLVQFTHNTSYRKIVREIKYISSNLSMSHEKINSERVRKKVFALDSLEQQKEYVDNLYVNHLNRNNVRKAYLANYDIDESKYHWNVSFFDGTHFKNKIDLFVGGSPCQSFSLVGKQRGLDDTRGTLFYEYARLVQEIQPKVFIYENVRAVLSNDEGRTWETMSQVFNDLGYKWKYQILNAKDYGIPQNRERLFVVGFRKDLNITEFNFPKPIELKTTMKDYLLDNVSGKYYLSKKGVEFVTSEKNLSKRFTQIDGDIQLCQKKNQQFNWHGDFVFVEEQDNQEELMKDLEKYFLSEKVKKYVLSSGTKGFYSKPETDLEIARPLLQSMHKMHRAGVDNYVTTEGRLRKLTPRECLRLMGFCDSFKIVVSDTSTYQQSGNSIVVDVLIRIMEEIIKACPNFIGGNLGE